MNLKLFNRITGNRKLQFSFFTVTILLVFITLGIFMSKAGLRGSDQYWYVADTESLLNGNGIQTNNILSYNVVNDSIVQNNGFIHNVPQVYIAALPGLIFGAFNGWLFMNALFCVLSAFLLFLTLKKFLPYVLSCLIALQFLVLPLTFWLAYQPLSESFHALLLTTILYLYYYNLKISRYYVIGILTVILLLCRNNYIILVPIISFLFNLELKDKYKSIYSLLYFISIIILSSISKSFLPDTWNFNFYDTIVTSKVGELSPSTVTELIKIYLRNLFEFFKIQFLTLNYLASYYLPFNFLIIGTIILWFKSKDKKNYSSLIIVIVAFIFILLTTIIFQNQARLMFPFYTLVIFAFFI